MGEITGFKRIFKGDSFLGKLWFNLMECDKPTVNGRVYPKEVVEKAIAAHQDRIKQRRFFCYPMAGDREDVGLVGVSHIITSLEISGDRVVGTAEIMNTPAGREVLRELAKGTIGVASGGVGKVEGGKVVEYDLLDVFFAPKKDLGIEEVKKKPSYFSRVLKFFI